MRRFIHKLRQKPKSTRRKIAFGASASITGVIFAVWLTVMVAGGGVGTAGTDAAQSQAASPLSALESNAGSAFSEVREQLIGTSTPTTTPTATTTQANGGQTVQTSTSVQPDRSQPVEQKPYWETNNPPKEDTNNKTQEATDDNSPAAESGGEFWSDDVNNSDKGWF
jgi:hypothetical protein